MNTVMVRFRASRKSRTRGTTTSRYDGRRSHPGSPCVLRYDHLLSRSSDKLAIGFSVVMVVQPVGGQKHRCPYRRRGSSASGRSEEHTSELQSRENLVCRLLLEKK